MSMNRHCQAHQEMLCRSMGVEPLIDTLPKQPSADQPGHVYMVIHSLDAPCMRSTAEIDTLCTLSQCPNVHIAASVDHVNSAALFNAQQRIEFAWLWHHVPTREPFYVETMGYAPILADAAAHETKQSASVVLAMLTPSSRAVRISAACMSWTALLC